MRHFLDVLDSSGCVRAYNLLSLSHKCPIRQKSILPQRKKSISYSYLPDLHHCRQQAPPMALRHSIWSEERQGHQRWRPILNGLYNVLYTLKELKMAASKVLLGTGMTCASTHAFIIQSHPSQWVRVALIPSYILLEKLNPASQQKGSLSVQLYQEIIQGSGCKVVWMGL